MMLPLCAALAGCIRDEIAECPPLQVRIGVKDKNYFNIDGAEHFGMETRKADDLPFKEYVSTLYYALTDAATGALVNEQTLFTVTSGDREIPVSFPQDLPFGTYVLTVWGNMQSERPLGDNPSASDLHLYNAEGNDVYLKSDTLVYDEMSFEYLIELERVKGKLIILAENLPNNINFSKKQISNVYAYVTHDFNYSKAIHVNTDTLWTKRNDILTKTLLCPSTDIDASNLHIDFYGLGAAPANNAVNWIVPEDIRITCGVMS